MGKLKLYEVLLVWFAMILEYGYFLFQQKFVLDSLV